MRDEEDRELLSGMIALHNGLIEESGLREAIQAWRRDKARPLVEHMAALGLLDVGRRDALEAMLAVQLGGRDSDAEPGLASLPTGDPALAGLIDTEPASPLDGSRPAATQVAPEAAPGRGRGPEAERFRILRFHDGGGLGEVFVALDSELRREVALKRIRDALADDPGSRARFRLEAEITGGLEHPGIVPVYGLGCSPDGRPYYAMRFIRGDTLRQAIEDFHRDDAKAAGPGERSLELRKLLRRFVDVCNAVDYAHSRGVLHRDIKPSNVIVGPHGETLVVDWGLAKARKGVDDATHPGPSAPADVATTLPGRPLGTPAYMSPEQAAGDLEQVGPRSDVYSLGATLYCLLVGRPPFEDGSPAAVLDAVRRGEFPPPRRRAPGIDPALEAICLKAMAKAPEGRYSGCRELADDVERWEADEPVSAWREPLSRRARRWMRRNRTAVIATAAAGCVALVGAGVTLIVQAAAARKLADANSQLIEANRRVALANADLTAANLREGDARRRAQDRAALAIRAVETFATTVRGEPTLQEPQYDALRRSLLNAPLEFFRTLRRSLEGSPEESEAARDELAASYASLAALTAEVGPTDDAVQTFGDAVAMLTKLAQERPDEPNLRRRLAQALFMRGSHNVRRNGDAAEGLRDLGTAAELQERLARETPGDPSVRAELADTYRIMGNRERDAKWHDLARSHLERSRDISAALARERPDEPDYTQALARVLNGLAILDRIQGRLPAAFEALDESIRLWDDLTRRSPADPRYATGLARALNSRGIAQRDGGRIEGAIASLARARDLHEGLVRDHPAVLSYHEELARNCNNLGIVYSRASQSDESLRCHARARHLYDALARDNPKVVTYRNELAVACMSIAIIHNAAGRPDLAVDVLRQAVEQYDILCRDAGGTGGSYPYFRDMLAENLVGLGEALAAIGRTREARDDFLKAAGVLESAKPGSPALSYNAACAYARAADLTPDGHDDGRSTRGALIDKAMSAFREAVEGGYRKFEVASKDADLDPLRSRPDFRLIMMDLAMPEDPFAPPSRP